MSGGYIRQKTASRSFIRATAQLVRTGINSHIGIPILLDTLYYELTISNSPNEMKLLFLFMQTKDSAIEVERELEIPEVQREVVVRFRESGIDCDVVIVVGTTCLMPQIERDVVEVLELSIGADSDS